MKKALITGVTGQDGSYLAEFLLSMGYEVHGLNRRSSSINTQRIAHLIDEEDTTNERFFLHHGDLGDSGKLLDLVHNVKPDEIYHLGAQSHVKVSFEIPEYTLDANILGTVRLLEAVRRSGLQTKIYQASSSEMFGSTPPPQNEQSPFHPRSPYAVSKVAAYWIMVNYRESYGMFASNGILFNHESPRRGETFITRKITRAVARIKKGLQKKLYLGNLEARRDWGFAPEYVEGMWRILQLDKPDDFVIGSGETHSVREFAEAAFSYADMDWQEYVEVDPRYFRPAEVNNLATEMAKARDMLHWQPRIKFQDLVKIMVDYDLESLGLTAKGEGKKVLRKKMLWLSEKQKFEIFQKDLEEALSTHKRKS
ncbi:MAG: GDP-mannose 4,6-dehydratase [Candidatus Omnitrophota bacterium]|nr:GDP-mannose 4,6-dehydratase [Candidatus Omnitrophota bacterium]